MAVLEAKSEDIRKAVIAFSMGYKAYVEYHDYSNEFIPFLRACLLVYGNPDERNRRCIWKSVADHDVFIAQNFLCSQNRVVLAKWMLNCLRVTILALREVSNGLSNQSNTDSEIPSNHV